MFFNLACQNVEIIKFAILLNTEERRRGQNLRALLENNSLNWEVSLLQ